jgi:hypothetical protein
MQVGNTLLVEVIAEDLPFLSEKSDVESESESVSQKKVCC